MRTTLAIATFLCIVGPILLDRSLVGPVLSDRSVVHAQAAQRGQLTVTNPTADARPSETITLTAADLQRVLGAKNLQLVHVQDRGADLLTQAIDVNDDGTFDELIFQTDLKPREMRRFSLATGERRIPKKEEFRAYGRLDEPCDRCGTPIEKTRVGGRGTWFCPHCQVADGN